MWGAGRWAGTFPTCWCRCRLCWLMLATEMFVMHSGRQQELQPPRMLCELSTFQCCTVPDGETLGMPILSHSAVSIPFPCLIPDVGITDRKQIGFLSLASRVSFLANLKAHRLALCPLPGEACGCLQSRGVLGRLVLAAPGLLSGRARCRRGPGEHR